MQAISILWLPSKPTDPTSINSWNPLHIWQLTPDHISVPNKKPLEFSTQLGKENQDGTSAGQASDSFRLTLVSSHSNSNHFHFQWEVLNSNSLSMEIFVVVHCMLTLTTVVVATHTKYNMKISWMVDHVQTQNSQSLAMKTEIENRNLNLTLSHNKMQN